MVWKYTAYMLPIEKITMCMLIFKMVLSDEFRSGFSLRPSEASKDTHKVREQPSEIQLPVTRQLVKQSPVPSPSVKALQVSISGKWGISFICFMVNVFLVFWCIYIFKFAVLVVY